MSGACRGTVRVHEVDFKERVDTSMGAQNRIVCSQCHGDNDRGSRFCWYCGAPLGRLRRASRAQLVALDLGARLVKWLVFLGILAGVVYGVYYALDRHVWPAVQSAQVTTTMKAPTTSTAPRTTTTTLPPREDRLVPGGADRYATAIAISKMAFPDGAPGVVLVPGDNYLQGLTAAPLAAAYDGPVLLLPPGGLRDDVAAEIERLAPEQLFLVALPDARSIEKQLKALLQETTVTRITGGDGYETAAAVADALKKRLGTISKIVLAPSDSFLEAIVVSPLAAANGWPILLAPKDEAIPWATRNAVEQLGAESALVVGLKAVLKLDTVETQAGTGAFDTASLIVRYAADHGCDFTHVAIASGDAFPEALLAASYLALDRGILIPATNGRIPPSLASLLDANLEAVRTLDFIALPELAGQMAVVRSSGNEGGGGSSATTGTGSTATTDTVTASTTTTERSTKPSAGGW